jgi:phosphate-selective porin OprO/OprP
MNHRRIIIGLVTVIGAVSLGAGTAWAQDKSIEQRLEELEQEIRLLKHQQELDKEAAANAAEQAKKTPIVRADNNGFALKSADGNFELRLRGYLQADSVWFVDDDAHNGTDTFQITRARPILEGTLFKDFDFKIMPDFGRGASTLYDGYLGWNHWPWLKARIGKFKPPVGLERLQSATDIRFIARAFPTSLVPTRDVGLQLWGDISGGVVQYQAGVFNGVVDGGNGDIDNGDGKDFEGRIFIEPFKRTAIDPLQGLGLGVAGTTGNQDGSPSSQNLPSYKTPGQNTFFRYATTSIANGNRVRFSPQGYYYWGPFGLLGECVWSEQKVQNGAARDYIRNNAWQVAGSFLLTGERASFKGVAPKNPFDLKKGGWGAFEVVGRYSVLRVDPKAFPTFASLSSSAQEARDWGIGLNWYLNQNVKLALDYDETSFDGGATGGTNRETERAIFTRAQVAF